jgi:hypothetical protein
MVINHFSTSLIDERKVNLPVPLQALSSWFETSYYCASSVAHTRVNHFAIKPESNGEREKYMQELGMPQQTYYYVTRMIKDT